MAVSRQPSGGSSAAHAAALPTTDGDSVSYPIPTDQPSTGWSLALWLVCHATELHATSVTFDGRLLEQHRLGPGLDAHHTRSRADRDAGGGAGLVPQQRFSE